MNVHIVVAVVTWIMVPQRAKKMLLNLKNEDTEIITVQFLTNGNSIERIRVVVGKSQDLFICWMMLYCCLKTIPMESSFA